MADYSEIKDQIDFTHPTGSQRHASAMSALGALQSALDELASFGHRLVAVWGTAEEVKDEWPKMVYSGIGTAIVQSQEDLDGLEGEWSETPVPLDPVPQAPVVAPAVVMAGQSVPLPQNPHQQLVGAAQAPGQPVSPGASAGEASNAAVVETLKVQPAPGPETGPTVLAPAPVLDRGEGSATNDVIHRDPAIDPASKVSPRTPVGKR